MYSTYTGSLLFEKAFNVTSFYLLTGRFLLYYFSSGRFFYFSTGRFSFKKVLFIFFFYVDFSEDAISLVSDVRLLVEGRAFDVDK